MSDEAPERSAPADVPPRPKSKLYLSALAEARRLLGKQITPANVVEHLLHDNQFHVLFPSHDGRSIGEDCRDCAEEIVGDARALKALAAAPTVDLLVSDQRAPSHP